MFLEKLVNLECSQILVEMPFYFSAMLCQRRIHYLILVSILLNSRISPSSQGQGGNNVIEMITLVSGAMSCEQRP